MDEKRTDPRLIIEKGGYSPFRGGPTRPPIIRGIDLDPGFRPKPPVTHAPESATPDPKK